MQFISYMCIFKYRIKTDKKTFGILLTPVGFNHAPKSDTDKLI